MSIESLILNRFMAQQLFQTMSKENFASKWKRIIFNLIPAYWATGGKIRFISSDWQEVHISLKRKLRTRNFVGSVFGGSIYSCTDPIYMTQLLFILGKEYVVWDKSAEVRFLKPIYKSANCKFKITDEQIADIKEIVRRDGRCNYEFVTYFEDVQGTQYAEIKKTLYISTKAYYKQKLAEKKGA